MTEGDIYTKKRRVGEVTNWQCEREGICKARMHTEGMEITKRTNEHLHGQDEQEVSCREIKVGIKRKAHKTQDGSHCIVGESLQTHLMVLQLSCPN